MRAVNLLPADSGHRAGGGVSLGQLGPVHAVLGALLIVLVYVTVYVMTTNTISQRKTQLVALHQQISQEKAQVARFNSYTQFAQLAQQRESTVQQIASTRFDWHGALTDLSKVMPAKTTLESITATVAPGLSVSGTGGSAGSSTSSSVRGDINAPAFELTGCTATQDDVARFISRLRLINDVQRVTLESSAKAGSTAGGASSAASGSATGACAGNGPTFALVVFFQPLPGASGAAAGAAPGAASPISPQGASANAAKASNPSTPAGSAR